MNARISNAQKGLNKSLAGLLVIAGSYAFGEAFALADW
jgi:hypothetical protein